MWCSLHAPLLLYGIYPCQANYDFPPRLFLTFAPIFDLFCWISLFDVHRTKKGGKRRYFHQQIFIFIRKIFFVTVGRFMAQKTILKYLVNPAGVMVQYCKENRQQLTPFFPPPFFLRFFLPFLLLCGLPAAVASNSHPPPHPLLPKKAKKAKKQSFCPSNIESERCQCQVYSVLERKTVRVPRFLSLISTLLQDCTFDCIQTAGFYEGIRNARNREQLICISFLPRAKSQF